MLVFLQYFISALAFGIVIFYQCCLSAVRLCSERAGPCQSPRAPLEEAGFRLAAACWSHAESVLFVIAAQQAARWCRCVAGVTCDSSCSRDCILKQFALQTAVNFHFNQAERRRTGYTVSKGKSPFVSFSRLYSEIQPAPPTGRWRWWWWWWW